jgi:hypothetical protein
MLQFDGHGELPQVITSMTRAHYLNGPLVFCESIIATHHSLNRAQLTTASVWLLCLLLPSSEPNAPYYVPILFYLQHQRSTLRLDHADDARVYVNFAS